MSAGLDDDTRATLELILDEILRGEGAGSAFTLGLRFSRSFRFDDDEAELVQKHVRALRGLLKRANEKEQFCIRLLRGFTEGLAVLKPSPAPASGGADRDG